MAMGRISLALCLGTLGGTVQAACGPKEETFMSCRMADQTRVLAVCFDAKVAQYTYGPPGQPELTLSEPVATLDYLPWPGVGSAIWEEVTFTNGPYSYIVSGGFERPFGDEDPPDVPPRFGGVVVQRDGVTLAELACDPATVDFAWGEGLWDAKENLGQSWNDVERRWVDLPD